MRTRLLPGENPGVAMRRREEPSARGVARKEAAGDLAGVRDGITATWLLGPVVVALAVSWARVLAESGDVPTDSEVAAAAAAVRAAVDDGDSPSSVAIVLLPPWSMRPLQALGPTARFVVGSDGPAAELLGGRFRRVVAVVEPDAEPWRAALLPFGPPLATSRHGVVDVLVHDGGGPARFDVLTALPRARVDIDGSVCAEPVRGGVHCAGRGPWQRVSREWALVTENGREVVWAHPPPPGQKLTIAFDDVLLGDVLVVAAGHTRVGAEHARGAVVVDVVIDGAVAATLRRRPSFVVEPSRAALRSTFVRPVDDDGEGFRVTRVDTRDRAGTRAGVAFVVSAEESEEKQHFALDAFIPGPAGGVGAAP